MVALVLADAATEKFGGDSVAEARRNLRGYLDSQVMPQAPGRTLRGREAPQRCPGAEDQPPEASEAPARGADK